MDRSSIIIFSLTSSIYLIIKIDRVNADVSETYTLGLITISTNNNNNNTTDTGGRGMLFTSRRRAWNAFNPSTENS